MTNNDIFKKLRVALMLRDDEIVEILKLVDFNITKSELGAFFRNEDHPKYMECGDQILRNFLNGLVLHLRGTKENPKNPGDVLAKKKTKPTIAPKKKTDFKTGQRKSYKPDISSVKYKNKGSQTKGKK
ncbi:DUF1456 family protein [Maribacter polysiphoniae]|uniref:DUF1456 family protein n=1 Tax=Maribacter polysiphoniae TaxID=429344 RepID=A0A316E532_9FLAO|nr:DUF1456 family protein [Maribacter polysiphoniae]MBD1259182.1 DUF1456 family protein [Maribacter polysiphoniae]PWK24738.1 uncharacterized protein DUF1456 [Maribacter polysiphoniae]